MVMAEGPADSPDFADEIIERLSHYSVGIIGAAGDQPCSLSNVIGSGTLIDIGGRRGILTCGHVVEIYKDLPELGLARFVAGGPSQRRRIRMDEAQNVIVQSSDKWTETDLDLAFTFLPPDIASSLAAQGVFLNIEKNRAKVESSVRPAGKCIDAVIGLVAEYTGAPVVESDERIFPMRAVFHRGMVIEQDNGLLIFELAETDRGELPNSFGGMSGGGLWRFYFTEENGGFTITEMMLLGVASYERADNRKLACQGWARIDQGLISTVEAEYPR